MNLFEKTGCENTVSRIDQLTVDSERQWGKMDVAQMLAHCNVAYDSTFADDPPQPNFLMKAMLKMFVKPTVVGDKPYKKNSRTAPEFIIADERDFEKEKAKLIGYLKQCAELGSAHFENKESPAFGVLSSAEWNNLFYKHLDHHLNQFGV